MNWNAILTSPGAGLVLVVIIAGLILGAMLKAKIVADLPVKLKFVPTKTDEFPELDTQALKDFTNAYEKLGFTRVIDYRLEADEGKVQPGFGRVMYHAEKSCFAEINQAFPPKEVQTQFRNMGSMVVSIYDQDGHLCTTDRSPDPALAMLKNNKGFWDCHPGLAPEEIFGSHLALRDDVARRHGRRLLTGIDPQEYFEREKRGAIDRKERFKGKFIFAAIGQIIYYSIKPLRQWVG